MGARERGSMCRLERSAFFSSSLPFSHAPTLAPLKHRKADLRTRRMGGAESSRTGGSVAVTEKPYDAVEPEDSIGARSRLSECKESQTFHVKRGGCWRCCVLEEGKSSPASTSSGCRNRLAWGAFHVKRRGLPPWKGGEAVRAVPRETSFARAFASRLWAGIAEQTARARFT